MTGDHAIVLGASMAGLLAARVLADSYRQVTVVERDALPETGENRRGVPHGRHIHALIPRGREIYDELFPGYSAELVAAGAATGDALADIRWQLSGHRFAQAEAGIPGLFASRPFFEAHVRDRVRALPRVRFMEKTTAESLRTSQDRRTVTGVTVCPAAGGAHESLTADLVVDATGRGSRTPVWLEQLGYQRPAEDRVEIGLGYSTRTYRLLPGVMGGDQLVLVANTPTNHRGGILSAMEGGQHILTVAGVTGDHPPSDPQGLTAFTASFGHGDLARMLEGAEPSSEIATFRFPASTRRRYERLRAFPHGLLVIGDAVSSFNPVYGQGMTVAGSQALELRAQLNRSLVPPARTYFRAIARAVDAPWDIAVTADLANPAVPGKRTTKVKIINAYLPRVHAAAEFDVSLAKAMVRVMGLLDPPQGLLRPDRVLRVLWTNTRHSGEHASPPRTRPQSTARRASPAA